MPQNGDRIEALVRRAECELSLHKGREAELLLQQAYSRLYDLLTPLHLKVVDVLRKLSFALDMQDKVIESAQAKAFISEMLANDKDLMDKVKNS